MSLPDAAPTTPLRVAPTTAEDHLAFVTAAAERGEPVSFLQTPAWARVKTEWRPEHLGWFAVSPEGGTRQVGAALVLHRHLPGRLARVPRAVGRSLAYVPEGPVLDWAADDLGAWLDPLVEHLRGQGAFGVRIGPPVVTRRWDAATVKAGIADDEVRDLGALAPTERARTGASVVSQLAELGWRAQGTGPGFAAGQPRHTFVVPLVDADGSPRGEEDVLAGMNQQWRRNIRKADKAGVEVSCSEGRPAAADLEAFHALYVHTAERDGFTPRGLAYFTTMADALCAEDPRRLRLWLARHEGDLVAATISVQVGGHVWYSYGASSSDKREVQGSNAVQWAMMRDAIASGAHTYDLRGITDTLDAEDAHVGLIRFKVGTGGEAREHVGEWDLPLRRATYAAFEQYMKRR